MIDFLGPDIDLELEAIKKSSNSKCGICYVI